MQIRLTSRTSLISLKPLAARRRSYSSSSSRGRRMSERASRTKMKCRPRRSKSSRSKSTSTHPRACAAAFVGVCNTCGPSFFPISTSPAVYMRESEYTRARARVIRDPRLLYLRCSGIALNLSARSHGDVWCIRGRRIIALVIKPKPIW